LRVIGESSVFREQDTSDLKGAYKMDIYEILIYAIPVLLAVGAVFYIGRKIFRWSENNHSELIKYELKITEKKEKYALLGASAANGLSNEASPKRYYLTGVTKDGKTVKCQVPYNAFDRAREGHTCLIAMQGTRFISFERLEEDEANG